MEDTLRSIGLYARFGNLLVKSPTEATAEIMVKQDDPKDNYIVLKALVFPYINVLWLGCLIMAAGTGIAIIERIRKFRQQTT
jgi:cytochrome c-type biogenesis protein CcmF